VCHALYLAARFLSLKRWTQLARHDHARVLRPRTLVYCERRIHHRPAPRAPHDEGARGARRKPAARPARAWAMPRMVTPASRSPSPAATSWRSRARLRRRPPRRPPRHRRGGHAVRSGERPWTAWPPGPGASRTAELAHCRARARADRERSDCERRDVRAILVSRTARLSHRTASDSSEDRLGADLAIAEAHLLFVQGAPLQGGGRDPQPVPGMQRA
jgi:hypothetical protein